MHTDHDFEPGNSEADKPRVPDANNAAMFYLAFIAVMLVGSMIFFSIITALGIPPEGQVFNAAGIIVQAILTVALLIAIVRQNRFNVPETFRLKSAPLKLYAIAIGGLISVGIVSGQFATILIDQFPNLLSDTLIELIELSRFQDMPSFLIFALSISLGPGISEELAFRGFILKGLEQSFSVHAAVWISALVFALFHLDPLHIILAFPAGLFLGYLVAYTGSILPAIVAHSVNNLWATLEANYWLSQESDVNPAEVALSTAYSIEVLLLFTAVLVLCLYGLHIYLSNQITRNNSQ